MNKRKFDDDDDLIVKTFSHSLKYLFKNPSEVRGISRSIEWLSNLIKFKIELSYKHRLHSAEHISSRNKKSKTFDFNSFKKKSEVSR